MKLSLHVVDEDGRINLAGIAPAGTHYTAVRNVKTGVVRLVPVEVATTATKTPEPRPEVAEDDSPWDDQ